MWGLLQPAFFYDPSPDFGTDPRPFVALMLVGFIVGIAGHLTRTKALIALGIGLIFLGTFLLPLAANVLHSR
ncbi:MAG TPA: hypothetical protein VKB54_20880 [Solirubrobacteraceae bacterium]|nr:hypothetical protein [Solirubrobacteraceae bacterium]